MTFNYLYKRYKYEILKKEARTSLKTLERYEKFFLAVAILGSAFGALFSLTNNATGERISLGIIFATFIISVILRNRDVEQQRIMRDIIKPEAESRFDKVVDLLNEFEIGLTDDIQLDLLIEHAKEQQGEYDVFAGFKHAFKGIGTYILLPLLTVFISEFFKGVNLRAFFIRTVIVLIVCLVIVVFIISFAPAANYILNQDIRDLDYFIRDLEDIKMFPAKAKKVEERLERERSEIIENTDSKG